MLQMKNPNLMQCRMKYSHEFKFIALETKVLHMSSGDKIEIVCGHSSHFVRPLILASSYCGFITLNVEGMYNQMYDSCRPGGRAAACDKKSTTT